jgi:hypothetical protein
MAAKKVYQFRAELFDFEPLIWRRFQVTGDITLARFCYIIMTLFAMEANHLFALEFPLGAKAGEKVWRYEMPTDFNCPPGPYEMDEDDPDDETPLMTNKKLSSVMDRAGRGFIFTYDFGDNWVVPMAIENEFMDEKYRSGKYPRVIEGEGYGIIEDCGGVYRLADIMDACKTKTGEDYKEISEWLDIDDLDLTKFDKKDMNFRLKKIPKIYETVYDGYELNEEEVYLIERGYLEEQSIGDE